MKKLTLRCFCVILLMMMLFNSCDNNKLASETTAADSTAASGTGAAPETTYDISGIEKNNLLYYRDMVRAGDWAMALEAALRENDEVYIPEGNYNMSTIKLSSGKKIIGEGDKTVIRALGKNLFDIYGSAGEQVKIAEDIPDFSDTVKLTSSPGLRPGDMIYLFSQRNCTILEDCGYEWVLGRSYKSGTTCFYAEFLTVESVSDDGLTVKTTTDTIFPFYRADGSLEHIAKAPKSSVTDYPYKRDCTTVQRVDAIENVVISSIKIIECTGQVFRGNWMKNCVIENVSMYTPEDRAPEEQFAFLSLSETVDCVVRECGFYVTQKPAVSLHNTSDDYGVYNTAKILCSQNSGFDGCYSDFASHSFLIGKSHKRGTSNGCYVKNCTASNAIWSGVYISGGCYNTTITGNTVTDSAQGITVAGKKNYIADNTIRLSLSPLTDYYYVRVKQGGTAGIALIEGCSTDSTVENNKVSEAATAFLIRDGYENTNIFESGSIIIRNNTATDCCRAVAVHRHEENTGEKEFILTVRDNSFTGGLKGTRFAGIYAFVLDPETTGQIIENNTTANYPVELSRKMS